LYREKDVVGGLCHGHISHLVHPETLIFERLETHKKMAEKSRRNLLGRASDSQLFLLASASKVFWQVTSST